MQSVEALVPAQALRAEGLEPGLRQLEVGVPVVEGAPTRCARGAREPLPQLATCGADLGVAPTAAGLGGASDAKGALIIHAVVAREHAAARVAVTGPGATRSAVGGAGDVCQGSVGIYAADEEYDREGSGQASPGQAQRGSFGAGKDHRCSPPLRLRMSTAVTIRLGEAPKCEICVGNWNTSLKGGVYGEGSLTKRRAGKPRR